MAIACIPQVTFGFDPTRSRLSRPLDRAQPPGADGTVVAPGTATKPGGDFPPHSEGPSPGGTFCRGSGTTGQGRRGVADYCASVR
jgi:hypothetical protein